MSDALLLETGDDLLTESGDTFITEGGGGGSDSVVGTMEDPCAMTSADPFFALRVRTLNSGNPGSTDTYLASEVLKPLNDHPSGSYGGRKRPDILDLGIVSKKASDLLTGQPTPTTHTLLVADAKRFWRNLRDTHGGNLNDAEFWMYLFSSAHRLGGGDPRLLNYGFLSANPLTDALAMQIVVHDILGHSKRLFTKNPKLPQRTIRGANTSAGPVVFTNFIDPDLRNPRSVPFSLGPCISKLPDLYGAVPAICLNEFIMADGFPWVLGLLIGNDAKGGIQRLFQPKGDDEVGLIPDDDPDTAWPGQTGGVWPTINPSGGALVTVLSSETFLLFALRADSDRAKAFKDNSRPIYANFRGPTDTADGLGIEMTDAHVIKPWVLKNFILRTPGYLTGSYYTTWPTFDYFPGGAAVAAGNEASFARSLAIANALGGIKWGGIVGWHGDQTSVDDVQASMNRSSLSMTAWCGPQNQYTDIMFDFTGADVLRTTTILDPYKASGIQRDPKFSEEPRTEWFTDNLHLSYAYEGRSNDYVGDVQLPGNDEQFLSHGSVVKEYTAPFIVTEASANIVCQALLDLLGFQMPSLSKWTRTWCGLEDTIGDGRAITHYNGNGGNGYVNAPHVILGEDYAIGAGRVIHSGLYVGPLAVPRTGGTSSGGGAIGGGDPSGGSGGSGVPGDSGTGGMGGETGGVGTGGGGVVILGTGYLPARPDAFGYGMGTRNAYAGGVAPNLYRVTTLSNSGTGSLRAALEATEPRIVVVDTSGTIVLSSDIIVQNPYVRLCGQTAPAPGITVKGFGIQWYTHDWMMQHMRIRPGDGPPLLDSRADHDGSIIYGPNAYNGVFDHNSISWAQGKNFDILSLPSGAQVCFWRNISAEALYHAQNVTVATGNPSSLGLLIAQNYTNAPSYVSIIGNLIANCSDRNPEIQGPVNAHIVNNVISGWGKDVNASGGYPWATFLYSQDPSVAPMHVAVIGNEYIGRSPADVPPLYAVGVWNVPSGAELYLSDNLLDSSQQAVTLYFQHGSVDPRVTTSPVSLSGLTIYPSAGIEASVLAWAGARPANRDSVDTRIVSEAAARTGGVIASQSSVGGWPSLAVNTSSFTMPTYPHDVGSDGYTPLERALHAAALAVE